MYPRFIPGNHSGAEYAGLEGDPSGVFTVPGCSLLPDWLLRCTHRKAAWDSRSREKHGYPGSALPAQIFSLWAFFSHICASHIHLAEFVNHEGEWIKEIMEKLLKYFKTIEIIVGMTIRGLSHVANME